LKFGKYKIINKIATGGMAEVFKAKITGEMGFEKHLVLKKVLPHLADEEKWIMHFTDEAKLAALLQHENIIHIYDFGKTDDRWFMAMEYLPGKDLKEVIINGLEKGMHLSLANILLVISKICAGLDYAHQLKGRSGKPLKIIHRDISPQNIFLTFDGKVKIIDFGIARAAERSVQTQTGIIKGKLAYMSPEQGAGKAMDSRSDIFAVGILLYELLTRKRMYKGEVSEILLKVIQADYESVDTLLEGYPSELFEILGKALAKKPDDRYHTAGEMQADIENFMYTFDFRSSSKDLADYMQIIFKDDYDKESENFDLFTDDEHENEPDINKTAILDKEDSKVGPLADIVPVIKEKIKSLETVPAMVSGKVIKAAGWLKKVKPVSRKSLTTALICLLILFSITGGWMLKKSNDQKVAELLTAAANCMKKGALTEPADQSAYYYYKEILDIDGDNEEAEKGIEKILKEKIRLAKAVLDVFRHEAALEHIHSGLSIEPDNKELLKLKAAAEENVGDRILGNFKTIFGAENKK